MRARLLINLLLLVLVLGLGLWLWLVPEQAAEAPVAISELDTGKVQTIRLQRRGHEAVEIGRQADGWQLLQPFAMQADDNRAQSLLLLAALASQQRFAAIDMNLTRYGLEPEASVLYLDDERFVIGDEHPMLAQRYVLHRDYVHLIPDTLQQELILPSSQFADGRLLPVSERPQRILLPDRVLTLVAGEWQAEPALEERSPAAAANAWRTAYARAVRPHDEFTTEYFGVIEVEYEHLEPIRLHILSPVPNVVLARPQLGVEYELDADQIRRLLLAE